MADSFSLSVDLDALAERIAARLPASGGQAELKPLSVSVATAAQMLGISKATCYRLIAKGTIPSVRLGEQKLVVPFEPLEKMIQNGYH